MTADPNAARFRILATSDLHVHLFPYDYYTDQPSDRVGLARTASLIAKARAEVGQGLLLDNGDFLQGNPMGDFIASAGLQGLQRAHPMIRAMNMLGYDGGTLGNHDFDHGLDFLCNALTAACFPLVCANIRPVPGSLQGARLTALVAPTAILDRQIRMPGGETHRLRIGLTGVVPPQISQWARAQVEGNLLPGDMVGAARLAVDQLRAAGADLVIVLAHTGIGAAQAVLGMENAATAIAALPGVDVVIAGHGHQVFPGPGFAPSEGVDPVAGTLAGKPAVMPGFWGSHLGVIDLDLHHDGGGWQIAPQTIAVWPILSPLGGMQARPAVNSAAEVLDATYADHAATLTYIRRPIGQTAVPLNTFFALLTESPATRIVAEAQAAHVAKALRGGPHEGLPVLSATAPFKAGGRGGPTYFTDIPVGDLAMRHLADLYIYPNAIRALRLTGAQVADWLEHAAGVFRQLQPGQRDQMLINPDFACYNFDTMSGLTYEIDLCSPPRFDSGGRCIDPDAHRLHDLRLNGLPLEPDQPLIVATNSYRAGGGGGFPGLQDGHPTVLESHLSVRDILALHVVVQGHVSGFDQPSWRFRPQPGTSALFDTAPAASDHLAEAATLDLQPMGLTPQGFARFRLSL